jgi:DNA-binding transcriptional MerR regulator
VSNIMRLGKRNEREVLKIGELAETLGTTARTIRLYEELGLIAPERTEGGTRLYAKKDLKRMATALQLSRVGINLESLQKLAMTRETYQSGQQACKAMLPLLNELRGRIGSLMADLEHLQLDLERADMLIRQCNHCPNKPNRKDCPDCPVEKNVDLSGIARLVWDSGSP